MPLRRYTRSPIIRNGLQYGTSAAATIIRNAVRSGEITSDVIMLQEGERLDVIAGRYYSDGRLWWILAAASGIGWGAQVPPGTRVYVPRDLSRITELIG